MREIAVYFEQEGNFTSAGKYFLRASDFERAFKLLLLCDDDVGLDLAIELVCQKSLSIGSIALIRWFQRSRKFFTASF